MVKHCEAPPKHSTGRLKRDYKAQMEAFVGRRRTGMSMKGGERASSLIDLAVEASLQQPYPGSWRSTSESLLGLNSTSFGKS